jgi:hypothetical protein
MEGKVCGERGTRGQERESGDMREDVCRIEEEQPHADYVQLENKIRYFAK